MLRPWTPAAPHLYSPQVESAVRHRGNSRRFCHAIIQPRSVAAPRRRIPRLAARRLWRLLLLRCRPQRCRVLLLLLLLLLLHLHCFSLLRLGPGCRCGSGRRFVHGAAAAAAAGAVGLWRRRRPRLLLVLLLWVPPEWPVGAGQQKRVGRAVLGGGSSLFLGASPRMQVDRHTTLPAPAQHLSSCCRAAWMPACCTTVSP